MAAISEQHQHETYRRNARIHAEIQMNLLASPPLVVAYASPAP
ncbi:hypothetical protein [Thermomonas sp.]|nr:hypothetical protein [Thermomonas sp.]MDI1253301.1 hypothetical protein [Thermomonas sp.]